MSEAPLSVAVLGAGNMGAAVARALASGGVQVALWNRTHETAVHVASSLGVTAIGEVAEAVRSADVVFILVNNYPTTRVLLDEIDISGKTLVGYVMTNPSDSQSMADWARMRDARFIEGMIMTLPEAVGTDACRCVYAAPPSDFAPVEELLQLMGQAPVRVSDKQGAVALLTGVMAGYFWTAGAIFVLMSESAKHFGVDYTMSLDEILAGMPVIESECREATAVMLGEVESPSSVTISRGAETTRVLLTGVEESGLDGQLLRAVHDLLAEATDRGYGGEPLGRLAAFYRGDAVRQL